MDHMNKRTTPRESSPNLLSFVCYDQNGNKVSQGMAKTLNVSEGGLLIETHSFIDENVMLSLTVAFGDDLMDLKGKVVHSRKSGENQFEFGIEFIEMDEIMRGFIKQYMIILDDQDGV